MYDKRSNTSYVTFQLASHHFCIDIRWCNSVSIWTLC